MITFMPVILAHHKRRDGTYPVKMRVTFRGKARFLPTTIICAPSDVTRGLKIKNPAIIARCNEITDRMRNEASALNTFDLEGKDVDDVVRMLRKSMRKQDFRLDFFQWADTYLTCKSEGNRRKYDTALRAFARFLGEPHIDINDITHALLVDFADACDAGPKMSYSYIKGTVEPSSKPRTGPISPHYLSKLSHIYDAAKERYNDEDGGAVVIPRSPFRKLNMTPPAPTTAQKALPVDVLQAMIDDDDASPMERRALDVFLVGFALMGANIADLWEAAPPRGRWWGYNRRKTRNRRADGAFIRCEVSPFISPLLARLGEGSSRAFWLPVVRALGKDAAIAGMMVNRGLRSWCERRGVEVFTYYAGRHSWATLARKIGIEKATVDEGLGHVGDYKIADIYAERDWERIAEANRRVLALLRW
jgi:hypothetical protein